MTNFSKIDDMPQLIVATAGMDRDAMLAWLRLSGEVTATMSPDDKDAHAAEWFEGAVTIAAEKGSVLAMEEKSYRINYVNRAQFIVGIIGMVNGEVVPGRAAEFLNSAWDAGELKKTSLQTVATWLSTMMKNNAADDAAENDDDAADGVDDDAAETGDADSLTVILSLIPHLSADDAVLAFAALEAHADSLARNSVPVAERIYVTA